MRRCKPSLGGEVGGIGVDQDIAEYLDDIQASTIQARSQLHCCAA